MNPFEVMMFALGLSLLIEIVTVYLRLVEHRMSAPIQKKLNLPRIHHSYPGFAILLLDYVYLQNEFLFSLGFALIFSDVFHHLVFEPYIKKHQFDIGMPRHNAAHQYASRLPSAMALIGVGLFALAHPAVPGSWLTVVGIGMLARRGRKHAHPVSHKSTAKKKVATKKPSVKSRKKAAARTRMARN